MRLFARSFFFFIFIIFSSSIALMDRHQLTFPRDPGPTLNNMVRANYLKYIEENHPQIVIIGDSTLGASVDADKLAQETGKSVYSISIPGSASALWYLILKSNIAGASYKPDYFVIVFRDTILTAPGYRVHGSYFDLLDEYADHNEPLITKNSFVNFMNPPEIAAEKYLPLYVSRSDIRKTIDMHIRYFAPSLFGCNQDCTDYVLGNTLAGAELEPKALMDAVGAAESYLYTPERLDFDSQVNKSYLPEMVRISKENNIEMILVRIKVKSAPPESLDKISNYIDSMGAYVAEKNVPLLNFGVEPRLTNELFLDSIHLNEKGKAVFTQLLSDGLTQIFAER